ncbi:superinfection immunity protein [Vibrio comitans]
MSEFITTFLLVAFTIGLLPVIIAKLRNHNNLGAIIVCTVVGWFTGVFWLVALIWAFTANVKREEVEELPHDITPDSNTTKNESVNVEQETNINDSPSYSVETINIDMVADVITDETSSTLAEEPRAPNRRVHEVMAAFSAIVIFVIVVSFFVKTVHGTKEQTKEIAKLEFQPKVTHVDGQDGLVADISISLIEHEKHKECTLYYGHHGHPNLSTFTLHVLSNGERFLEVSVNDKLGFDKEKPLSLKFENHYSIALEPKDGIYVAEGNYFKGLQRVGDWHFLQGIKVEEAPFAFGNDWLIEHRMYTSFQRCVNTITS